MGPHEIIAALDRAVTADITTTGRRSGLPRRIEIWMVKVDGCYVITGTPGARDWYANLLANPDLILHLKGEVLLDLPAEAVPILEPRTRRAILTAPETAWYRREADVEAMVADSPMVKLVFRGLDNGGKSSTSRSRSAP
jgi:deazaflavin-dependent oxidoreductase (nitroreductase family)